THRFTRHFQKETGNGPTQEILNHLYTLFDSTPFAFPWTVNTVKKVHALLMKGVETDLTPGQMRDETEKDAATYGPDGVEYFIACPWSSVAEEMRNLTDWLVSSPYDELITATLFFHEFESIHPFLDGNGRTGRTLFQLLLQMLGLRNCRLCKFEYEMLRDRERYYTLLAYTDSSHDYMPFIMYTAEAVLRAYQEAAERFSAKDRVKDLDEVSKILARQAKKVRCFTVAEATSWITGLGSEAVRSRLGALISAGILTKEGNTRASRYFFRDPFAAVKTAVMEITAENNLRSSISGGAAVDRSEKN
ncbi:MAG: Fic family protein, partial [Candidatus Methanomethylophilus sp.]|nr:Fic family protein [Methanomethylophilus sp.]